MKSDTAILLIAAGASKRLGSPKQLLLYKNQTLLENTLSKLLALKMRNVYVVLGAYFDDIHSLIMHLPITVIRNNDWQEGMGTSISKGISYIRQEKNIEKVLITLVDLPLFETVNYQQLLDTHASGITITKYTDNKGVPTVFDKRYFKELIVLSGDEGARSMITANKNDVRHYEPNIAYFDIDTMSDYEKLTGSALP